MKLKHFDDKNDDKHYKIQIYLFALMCRIHNEDKISFEAFN